ncbi:C2 domain-containing protein [Mucor mucedo]|uniref:C2 domain-containing protein n=1 Tax=Mucor mucedo TaxID=29922 RepID=UPI0022206438|nr:C2 domain-containing protein [Mucor mucedo]KAI7888150.1 C2 domain-containing protein [Mucor mucedo]
MAGLIPSDGVPAANIANATKDEIIQESNDLHQAVHTALENENGAPVHTFDPDMSAQNKKAEAMKDVPVPKIMDLKSPLATDIGSTDNQKVAEAFADPSTNAKSMSSSTKKTPGSFVEDPIKAGIPDWYNVGWTAFSNLPNPGDEKAMAEFSKTLTEEQIKDKYYNSRSSNGEVDDFIAQFISEKYYGEWYHNCGVVFVAIFFTWLLIKLRLGLMSCLIVGAFFATYYRTSIKRTRRNARDDMSRQVSLTRLDTDIETVGWMNLFLSRFWLIFEPVLSAQIIGQVDTVLAENTPSFLDSIRMSSFTLGTKAPSVDGIKVYPGSAPDIVCMDWKFSFIPNDVLDMTKREADNKVNPKIVLTIRVGKGMIGAGMPVLLEDIAFSGTMRIKLKLFNEMPHVKTCELSFLEKPHFDYVLKPVGGDTFGFDINNIPGLQTFIQDQVHANLGPMMYAPNVFTLDVAAMMAGGADLDSANGVLAVTIYSAHGLKANDLFGSLDPYCCFKVGDINNPELGRTTAIENSQNPKWNETHFVLLNNLNDMLCFQVMDRNSGRNDAEIGVANLALKDVEEAQNAIEGLNLVVLRSGKPVGEIKADVRYFPASKPEKKEDGTVIPAVESNSGIVRFSVLDCKDVGGAVTQKKGGIPLVGGLPIVGGIPIIGSNGGDVNAYAIVKVNGQEKLRTNVFKRSINPRWNKFVEVFVADKANMNLDVTIMNSVDFGDDTVLGRWSSSLMDMENQLVKDKNDWWSIKDGTGKIHLNMIWKPVPLTGFSAGLTRGSYRHPIGVVRVKLNNAKNIKNVEVLTGGKSDPYVRVMSGLQSRGRTEAILDNLNPVWDTAIYVPIHSVREDLMLEVMDWNDISDDKFLGMCDLLIKDIAVEKKTDDGETVYESLAGVSRTAELMNHERKTGRGQLNYEASFFPTLALAHQATKEESEAKEKAAATAAAAAATTKDTKKKEETPIAVSEPVTPTGPPLVDLHGESIHYTEDKRIDLLSYESGVLSVKIHEVVLPKSAKAVAEILVDSNDAQFRTSDIKGTKLAFHESGDAFVREMDLSRIIVRVRDAKDDNEENRIGFWTSRVQDIVKAIQDRPAPQEEKEATDVVQEYKLLDCAGGTIRLSFKFTPVVQFKLDPSESLENQGNLTVTALSASGLRAADKSGTSDPYCVFSVNDEKVYKTETYKKQLAPTFKNETFVASISRRNIAKFYVKIFDWDQFGENELLAEGPIPIADLESFAASEVNVPLRGGGNILLRLKWEPQLLARKREGTSLLGSTTRILTGGTGLAGDMVGMGVGAGGKVITGGSRAVTGAVGGGAKIVGGAIGGGIGAIGGGIGAIGRGFGKIGGNNKKPSVDMTSSAIAPPSVPSSPTTSSVPPMPPMPPVPNSSVSTDRASRQSVVSNSVLSSNDSLYRTKSIFEDRGKNATIKFSVVGARGLKSTKRDKLCDSYVRIRHGKNTIHKTKQCKKTCEPEWNETFVTKVFGTTVLDLVVREHNTLTDHDIGEASFQVAEYVDEGKSFDGWLPLVPSGSGEIHIRVEVVTK